MTIHVTCDSCYMNYQLKDELAGRKVRCKHCQSIIEVPRPGTEAVESIEDPWMAEDEDEAAEEPRAPAPARKQKRRRKKSRDESSSGFQVGTLAILGIAFAGMFVLMCLVGIFWRPMWSVLGVGTAVIGGGLTLVGGIGMMMAAFEEDTMCGVMYLAVPFYGLYYIVTRIAEVWKLLLMHLGGTGMLLAGLALHVMAQAGGGPRVDGGGFDFSLVGGMDEDSKENLRQIGLGMFNHHDAYNQFAPAPTEKSGGQVHISWQTALLPFIDEAALFNQINQSVPWDDPANDPFNRALIDRFRQYAVDETNDARGYGLSHYALNQALLGPEGGVRIRDITDGTSNTVMSGEVGAGYKPWADPSNARAVEGSLTPGPATFGNTSGKGAYMLFADGSVRWLSSDIDPAALQAIGTPGAGDIARF